MFQIMSTKRRAETTPRRQSHARGGPLPNQENVHDRPNRPHPSASRKARHATKLARPALCSLASSSRVAPTSHPRAARTGSIRRYSLRRADSVYDDRSEADRASCRRWTFELPRDQCPHVCHVSGRDPGVWFFNLEAANSIAVRLARRLFHLPYHYARCFSSMRPEPHRPADVDPLRRYEALAGPVPASYFCPGNSGWPGRPATPGTLAHFLAERYILFTFRNTRLHQGRVHHTPYPLQSAKILSLDETLLAAAGIARPDDHPPGTLLHRCQRRGIPASRGLISATPNVFAYPQFLIRHAWALHRAFCSCTRRVIGALDHI